MVLSILRREQSGLLVVRAAVFAAFLWQIYASDICKFNGVTEVYQTSTDRCNGKDPLVDPRLRDDGETKGQCRTWCRKWKTDGVEVVLRSAKCDICKTKIAEKDYSDTGGYNPDVCVDSEKCISECGEPDKGCIYSGTCATFVCFVHRADPNLPAKIEKGRQTQTGEGVVVSVTVNTNNTATSSSGDEKQKDNDSNPEREREAGEASSDYEGGDTNTSKIIVGAVGAVFAVIAAVAIGLIVSKLEVCSRSSS